MKHVAIAMITALSSFMACVGGDEDTPPADMLDVDADAAGGTIVGRVLDESGRGIANALVYKTSAPDIYAKTGLDGSYRLPGRAGVELYVAAFQYEDKQVTATTSSGFNVTLSRERLTNGRVYHNNFNYLRPGPHYSKEDARTDFNTYIVKGFASSSDASDNAAVDTSDSHDGKGSSLRVRYPRGQVTSGSSGVQMVIPLSNDARENTFEANELYFSYWFKLSPDFELNCGGKMPGLSGAEAGGYDDLRWSGRWMFRYGGSLQFYMHYADKGGGGDSERQDTMLDWGRSLGRSAPSPCSDELFTPYLTTGKWHYIEMRYKLNTPGRADGVIEGWLDDGAAHFVKNDVADFRIRGKSDSVTLNSIFFSTFYGGSKDWFKPTKDVYAWFDELTVSRRRIGYPRR